MAESEYRGAERLAPGYAGAGYLRASALQAEGKTGPAIAEYRRTLAIEPNYVPALNNVAYLYANNEGDYAAALKFAARAFMLAPGNGNVLDTYGLALLKNGRTPEAVEALEKSNKLLPGDPEVLYHLALACQENGDGRMAEADLRKSVSIGNFPDAGRAKALLSRIGFPKVKGRGTAGLKSAPARKGA